MLVYWRVSKIDRQFSLRGLWEFFLAEKIFFVEDVLIFCWGVLIFWKILGFFGAFLGFGISWTTGQIILLGRSNFPQDLPKMFLVSIRKSVYVSLKMVASTWLTWLSFFMGQHMAPKNGPIFSSCCTSTSREARSLASHRTSGDQKHDPIRSSTLQGTNSFAPKNGRLEYDPFLLGSPYFQGICVIVSWSP